MSLQIRRGTDAERLTITPLTAELIYTIDTQLVYVGDGVTAGGILVGSGGGNGNYGNANVVSLLNSGLAGNIIPTVDSLYSLGNATNQWADLYVSNNTIYLNNVPLSGNATTLDYNGIPLISANGSSNITTTGNITGAFILGDGSQLTGLPSGYSNSDVANYLASNANVVITTTGNITSTANVQATFFIGDGSQLTNLSTGVTAIPAIYFSVVADGNNQTFSNSFLSAYSSNTDITLFYNGSLLDSPYYTLSGDTITVNTVLTTGDSIDVIRQFASNVVVSTYSNANVQSYLASASVGDIIPAGNNLASLGNATNQWKDLWVSNATIYFNTLPLSVNANNALTFNGEELVISGGNQSISTSGNVDAGNVIVTGDISSNSFSGNTATFNGNVSAGNMIVDGDMTANYYVGNTANFSGNITASGLLTNNYFFANGQPVVFSDYGNANVANYLPTYTGNLDNVDAITTIGNITAGTGAFFIGDGGLLSNISGTGSYSNANVANYLPTYTGNLDSVNIITANVISSNATIIANSVTLGTIATPVSISQWTQQTVASATPIVLMTISAATVTHVDFNVVATDAATTSRQVSKLMAINYNGAVDYNEYGSLLIGSTVGDFTVTTDGTDIFLNVIPAVTDSVDYNVVAMIYY